MVQLSVLEKKIGIRVIMKEEMPWIVFVWCKTHRLELAIQDAFKGTFFDKIDDMILWIFYLYQKAPKKLQELNELFLMT